MGKDFMLTYYDKMVRPISATSCSHGRMFTTPPTTMNASFNQVEQLKAVSTYDGAEIFEEISEKGA